MRSLKMSRSAAVECGPTSMWEPGFWELTDTEAAAFRAYLLKGGFAVFEDFDGRAQWDNFESQMHRVLPQARFVRLDPTNRIFDSFFAIQDIEAIVHPMSGIRPSYFGLYEDNDPNKRLMVVANFDNDVPEYWEWSGRGLFPFANTNEAYKLGVNYMFSRLTKGNYEIWTIKPDGTGARKVTSGRGTDAHQGWSPDGGRIVFASSRLGFKDEAIYTDAPQPYGEIFVMRSDGTNIEQLTDDQWEEGTPAWRPVAGSLRTTARR